MATDNAKRRPFDPPNMVDQGSYRTTPVDPVVGEIPTAKEVERFHRNSDADGNNDSKHHTLGHEPGQASPGDHTHDGGSSLQLLKGTTISGATTSAALHSVINALKALGATDTTTF